MFTLDQIKAAHSKVKSGADFPKYAQELKTLGIIVYDNYVSDGRTIYYGTGDFRVTKAGSYPELDIAKKGSSEKLHKALTIHQQGQTDYLVFCRQAAEAGVEKWTVHFIEMTCTYYDKKGNKLIVEQIPAAV